MPDHHSKSNHEVQSNLVAGSPDGERLLLKIWPILLAVFGAYITWRPLWESDLFWHLALGRAVWEAKSRVVAEPFAVAGIQTVNIAIQWLWEVATYGLWRLGGWHAIVISVQVSAAAIAYAIWRYVSGVTRNMAAASLTFVSTAVFVIVAARIRERPETVSLLILPLFVLLVFRFADEVPSWRRSYFGIGLIALQLFWAQIHPYFVFSIPLFAVAVAPAFIRFRERRLHIAVVGIALGIGLLSSALGAGIFHSLLENAGGDVTRYVAEARDLGWESFNPAKYFNPPLYLLLVTIILAGIVVERSIDWRTMGLFAIGLVALSAASRGMIPAAILAAPAAAQGMNAIFQLLTKRARAPALIAVVLISGCILSYDISRRGEITGPGTSGLAEDVFPLAAVEALHDYPANTPVFTTYTAGPILGFLLDGRLKTYVDGRTPLVFDATEFAVARAAWTHKVAFRAAIQRFAFEAAVVDRHLPICGFLAEDAEWSPIATDPRFTTFIRSGRAKNGLRAVEPCGNIRLTPAACKEPVLSQQEIKRAARGPYRDFLSALVSWRCVLAERRLPLLDSIPPASLSGNFQRERDLLLLEMYVAFGLRTEAMPFFLKYVPQGDSEARFILLTLARRDGKAAPFIRVLKATFDALGDAASPEINLLYGSACLETGDISCARYHGLRAAVLGQPKALRILDWVLINETDDAIKGDLQIWRDTLAQRFASEATQPAKAPQTGRGASGE